MNIPDKVKVGGKTYTINLTEKLYTGRLNSSAEILYSDLVINISNNAKEKMEADFLHELTHAINNFMGLDNDKEEEVDRLANALHMVIKDNPEIFGNKEKTEDKCFGIQNPESNTNENSTGQPCDYCEYSFPKVELNYSYIIAYISSQCGIKDRVVWLSKDDLLQDAKEKYELNYCNKCGRKIKIVEPSKEIKDKIDEFRASIKKDNENIIKSNN